jgi:hypothetical protein
VTLPLNIIIIIGLLLLAAASFAVKKWIFGRGVKFEPAKVRRSSIDSFDGHKSWTLYENEIENWFIAEKLPHDKPQTAMMGQYYTGSPAIPFWVLFTTWDRTEIHSIVYIVGLDRPKKFPVLVRTPEIQPNYPELVLDIADFEGHVWRTKLFNFYKDLRKEVRKWAKAEEQRLQSRTK